MHGQAPVLMAALLGFACALLAAVEPATLTSPLGLFLPGFWVFVGQRRGGQTGAVWALAGAVTARHDALRGHSALLFRGIRALLFLTAPPPR